MLTMNQYYSDFKRDAILVSVNELEKFRCEVWHTPGQTCRFTFETTEQGTEFLKSISKTYNK